MTIPAPEALRRNVGLLGVVMFGAGTAIGVSIFSVLQPAAEIAGSGLLIAIAISMAPMLLFATVYAWLASIAPTSGASYEWPRRFLSPVVGFAIAWLRIISNVGAIVILARVLTNYLSMVFPIAPTPVIVGILTLVFALNLIGVAVAARLQVILMLALIAVLALFVVSGVPLVSEARIGPLVTDGFGPIIAAVPLLISLFLGIESAVEIGDEVRSPERTIPLGIALAILLTALVYSAVAATALGLIGPQALAISKAPLLDAAIRPLGRLALPIIVGAATVSIVKAINATALIFSRSIYAMAAKHALPPALAAIHPRFGTPYRAVIACYLAALAGLLMPPSLIFLLLAINIPTMLKYIACSLCAARVAANDPDLASSSRLRIGRRTITLVSWSAVVAGIVIILAGIESDWRPYCLVVGWLAVGMVFYSLYSRQHIVVTPSGPRNAL
ncbi:APC family permease [Sphingomonas sp. NFX23]|uniref:APC family permease n=1 Tax=Sphingomonas sp. NFX23 TaxID=2819532 RepID=UPI003CEFB82D